MKEKKNTLNTVFIVSLILTGIIALWSIALKDSFKVLSDFILAFLTVKFGWLYMIAMLFFVIFVLIIAMSNTEASGSARMIRDRNTARYHGLRCSSEPAWAWDSFSGVLPNPYPIISIRWE